MLIALLNITWSKVLWAGLALLGWLARLPAPEERKAPEKATN
jgi:hypothetical protein